MVVAEQIPVRVDIILIMDLSTCEHQELRPTCDLSGSLEKFQDDGPGVGPTLGPWS